MSTLIAQADGPVEAPADLVLEIIRDFDGHHRHILAPVFSDFQVLSGGVGAGTVTAFTTTLGGRKTRGQTVATEPEPGVVQEDVVGRDMVTTFRVEERGETSHATIRTTWTPGGGIDGFLEKLFAPRMLTKAYEEEIRLLQAYAKGLAAERAAERARAAADLARAAAADARAAAGVREHAVAGADDAGEDGANDRAIDGAAGDVRTARELAPSA